MPEGYTHLRIAAKAAAAMRHKLKWPVAFAAGANGPDIFFCYEAWRPAKKRRCDLPALGARLHEDDTGAFLLELVRGTRTGPQAEYTLGFLSHYAADAVIHPYVAALCAPGMLYAGPGGHGYFEIALDSALHKEDTGDAVVPAAEACPTPTGEALAEVTALLRTALQRTYGLDIPAEYIADSFFYSTRLRGLFNSRFGVRRALFWLIEPLFGGRGKITVHVSPRRLKEPLPDTWTDPATGAEQHSDIRALMEQAQERSRQYMAAAVEVWSGRGSLDALARMLGSVSYTTGTPTERSDPGYVPPAPPAPEAETGPTPVEAAPSAEAAPPAEDTVKAAPPAADMPPEVPAADMPPAGSPAGESPPTEGPAEGTPAAAPAPPALSAEEHKELLAEGLALITAAQAAPETTEEAAPAEEAAPSAAETPAPAEEAAHAEEAAPTEEAAPEGTAAPAAEASADAPGAAPAADPPAPPAEAAQAEETTQEKGE